MKASWSLLLTTSLVACANPTAPEAPVQFEIGSTFQRGSAIPVTVLNATDQVVTVAACGDRINPVLERAEGMRWALYASGVCLAIYPMIPLTLGPGDRRTTSLTVQDAGRYRFRISAGNSPGISTYVASAPFDVR